jgi:putative SOS response-associated peptidase YedK
MCHRVTPFGLASLEEALLERERSGHARIRERGCARDCYPGRQLPLFIVDASGDLSATELTWGFEGVGGTPSKLVFNTRLDTALRHLRDGRGMWAQPLATGRCLVPVRRFWESWTRNAPRRGAEVRFESRDHGMLLLAGVCERGRVSIVTTEPNAEVAPVHSRMPLVLAPGESRVWLSGDVETLADRSHICLAATPEEPADGQSALFDMR